MHSEGNQVLPLQNYVAQHHPSVNATTNLPNLNFNPDESLLLDSLELNKNPETKMEVENRKVRKTLKFESVYSLNEAPQPKTEPN